MDEPIEDLMLEVDREFLTTKGYKFTATRVGNDVHVVIKDFPFPEAYQPRQADVLILLPSGYPNANLDMFWTSPDVKLVSGAWPQNCEARTDYAGVSWQQWSRHFASAWRQNVDNLQTFVASIKHELAKGI